MRRLVDLVLPDPTQHVVGRRLFVQGLAFSSLVAFLSLLVQIRGLVGADGVVPAAARLARVEQQLGAARWLEAPTLCWLVGASDAALVALCLAGALASIVAAAGRFVGPALVVVWATYLSLSTAAGIFLAYQWDILLLETTALALLVVPWRRRLADAPAATRAGLFLLVLLLFRVMFSSGAGKLATGDPTWRDLSALTYHYWSQPLPTWTAYYAHHLPRFVHVVSCLGVFVIQICASVALFAGRRARTVGAIALAALQVIILATGNYGFFNLLALALCALAVDDDAWRRLRRPAFLAAAAAPASRRASIVALGVACVLGPHAVALTTQSLTRQPLVGPFAVLDDAIAPLRSANRYGLFTVMTTTRDEIEIEASDDGVVWRRLPFRHKPGDPLRAPRFVVGHMPRLDWQMWFASLGDARRNPFVIALQRKLADGEPSVRALLDEDALGPRPLWVRATRVRYRFAPLGDQAWWTREEIGPYAPPVARRAP